MDGFTVVEVWVIVDEDGDYAIGKDTDEAAEHYEEEIGGSNATPRRLLKLTVNVPTPKPVELTATVGEEAAAGELTAK